MTTRGDSDDIKLVHVSGELPRYVFPAKHAHVESAPHPDVEGHVGVAWDVVDAWFEEDERVLVHSRDPVPPHRHPVGVVARASEHRRRRARRIHPRESPVRDRVAHPLLLPARGCPGRTLGSERHDDRVRVQGCSSTLVGSGERQGPPDGAWSYDDEVRTEGEPMRGRIAFYNKRVDLEVDGTLMERPLRCGRGDDRGGCRMATTRQKEAARRNLTKARKAQGVRARGEEVPRRSRGLSTREQNRLSSTKFAFPKERKEPLTDATHVRNAVARFDQVEDVSDAERDRAWKRIQAAAKKFGVEISAKDWRELFKGGKAEKR